MEEHLNIDNSEVNHQVHLIKQRQLEINRNGVYVTYFPKAQGQQYSCFAFDPAYQHVISKWKQQKFSINVYAGNNLKQIAVLDRSKIFFDQNYLFLNDWKIEKILRTECVYVLAKNNATLIVLTNIFEQVDKIQMDISNFINDPKILQIQPNPYFQQQEWFGYNINACQKKALSCVIRNKLSFIMGPPGCGKTRFIARICTIFSYYGHRIIVGAVSNTANLSITRSMLQQSIQMNYLPNIVLYFNKQMSYQNYMHPPQVRALTFRYKLICNFLLLNKKQDITYESLQIMLDNCWSGQPTTNTFLSIYHQATAKTFAQASVVVCTTVSANKFDAKLNASQKFYPTIGILDEASQSTWADTYCFLTKGIQKLVLVGDNKQLSPTVISQNEVLKQTMFTKLMYKNLNYFVLLDTQYRMHPLISEFPNRYFYENRLKNGINEQERTSQIKYFKQYPVSFLNHKSMQIQSIDPISSKKNFYNSKEIDVIIQILRMFPVEEMPGIGIISPYDLQIRKITEALPQKYFQNGLTIRTCDGYQGGEKDYIIFSCVRSNQYGKIGFCGEQNRVNVSITRARKGLVLIGSATTLQKNPLIQVQEKTEQNQPNVWKVYIDYLRQKNLVFETEKIKNYIQIKQEKENIIAHQNSMGQN